MKSQYRISKTGKQYMQEQQIAGRLIMLRTSKGLPQSEIAKRLGITRSAYTYYETGRSEPSIASLIILASFYEISLDDLILGAAPKKKKYMSSFIRSILHKVLFTDRIPVRICFALKQVFIRMCLKDSILHLT